MSSRGDMGITLTLTYSESGISQIKRFWLRLPVRGSRARAVLQSCVTGGSQPVVPGSRRASSSASCLLTMRTLMR